MITEKQVKEDLAEIKYFYGKQEMFQKAFDVYGMCDIVKKVDKYSSMLSKLPPKLYELYLNMYVKNNTQEATASLMNFSLNHVWNLNKRLVTFFVQELNKEEVAWKKEG